MTLTTYSPNDVEPYIGPGLVPATVVGSNPVLSDDSDASYAEFKGNSATGQYSAVSALVTGFAGLVSNIVVRARVQALIASSWGIAVQLKAGDEVAGFNLTVYGFPTPAGPDVTNPTWVTLPLTGGSYGEETFADDFDLLVFTTGFSTTPSIRIFELRFDVTAETTLTADLSADIDRTQALFQGAF